MSGRSTFSLPDEIAKGIRVCAILKGCGISELVTEALSLYLYLQQNNPKELEALLHKLEVIHDQKG
jgi:hypothetical protein